MKIVILNEIHVDYLSDEGVGTF